MEYIKKEKLDAALAQSFAFVKLAGKFPEMGILKNVERAFQRANVELEQCFMNLLNASPQKFKDDLKDILLIELNEDLRREHFALMVRIGDLYKVLHQHALRPGLPELLEIYTGIRNSIAEFLQAVETAKSEARQYKVAS